MWATVDRERSHDVLCSRFVLGSLTMTSCETDFMAKVVLIFPHISTKSLAFWSDFKGN